LTLLGSLSEYLRDKSPLALLRHFLGEPLPNAPALLEEAVFVGLDLEWFEHYPESITEVGLAIFRGEDIRTYNVHEPLGHLFEKITIRHARIIENCHCCNRDLSPAAASRFMFGETRWVTIAEATEILTTTFGQRRVTDAGKDGAYAPVIFLGHGLSEDIKNLKKQWDLDIPAFENLVYKMETTPLAKEARVLGEKGVSLEVLTKGFGLVPTWLHNAGNDIAYTSIVALLIGLKNKLYDDADKEGFPEDTEVQGRPINDIIVDFRATSKAMPQATWGFASYCYRCESPGHLRATCKVPIEPCAICKVAGGPKNRKFRDKAKEHRTERCAARPYYHYEPLPDWVKERLSKAKVREFQVAKTLGDVETLGRLVLAAYPALMKDEEDGDMDGHTAS
jgi:hypothetical protein